MNSSEQVRAYIDKGILSESDFKKLLDLNNNKIMEVIAKFTDLCKPSRLKVISDSQEDINYVRYKAIELNEEKNLNIKGHTIHYDGFYDQARDKENTRILIPKGEYASPWINTIDRDDGLEEVLGIMNGCMSGKECLVRFFCLGPKNSKFTIKH